MEEMGKLVEASNRFSKTKTVGAKDVGGAPTLSFSALYGKSEVVATMLEIEQECEA